MAKNKQPKVVIFGGGTGLSVLIRGLKKYPVDITAVVTVADDGGSSGILRDELAIPPPGDIRNVLVALSEVEPLIEKLFQHRFETGNGLSGHAMGNLLLAAMVSITGDFSTAIQEISKVLNVRGRVLPAANQSIVLHAKMDDGTIVTGESNIPKMNKKIERVFVTPSDIAPLQETITRIRSADMIVIGPGSLYTSILPNLLVPTVGEEICKAKAKKVYVCNLMTQQGETNNYTASDHVEALYKHISEQLFNYIIVNNEKVSPTILERYALESAQPVTFDIERLKSYNLTVIAESLIKCDSAVIRHDTEKIARLLYELIQKKDINL